MDESDRERAKSLVLNPTESLNVELKAWIDPSLLEAQAKIVKGVMALRNRNGGSFIVGFDDKTLQPLSAPSFNVRSAFHVDDIQQLISKHSSQPFEIAVEFIDRSGQDFPVILVPSGVRTPVAVRRPLVDPTTGRELLKLGDVPFRTLHANGTFSSATAQPADWNEIVEICFENREADIGRFVRRHLSGVDSGALRSLASAFANQSSAASPNLKERAEQFLDVGRQRYEAVKAQRGVDAGAEEAAMRWGTWEVAAIIDPPIEERVADEHFYNSLIGSNPNYRPWASWSDTRSLADNFAKPETRDGAWESLLIAMAPRHWPFDFLTFMRLDPTGQFYQLRALEDDAMARARGGKAGSSLDPSEAVIQVADSIAVAMRYAKALGCDTERTRLGFAFRWQRLANRSLYAWSQRILAPPGHTAIDDAASSFVQVPLTTAETALAPVVEKVVSGLFAKFRGYSMPMPIIEQLIQRLLSRSAG
jgi:hypothetical protein